jgi:soluble lytic murein transglycosylase
VRSWLPQDGAVDPDIWAELIPFHETRDYVQRVFAYRIIYAVRLGTTPPSLNTLLFPITPQDRLAQAREAHLAGRGVYGTVQLATQDFCDAPGYTIATCL